MIVKSILDTDLYKFTTSYAYMKLFPQARGTFEFFDRDLTEYPEDFVQKVYLELSNLGMLRLTNSDLEQIGAKSYDEVDDILSRYIPFKEYRQKHGEPLHPHDEMAESDCWSQLCVRHGEDVVNKVWSRHLASEFKRKKAPIYISRELYE